MGCLSYPCTINAFLRPGCPPLQPRRFMSRLSLLLPRQPLRPLPSLRRYFLPRLPIGISPSALDFGLSKRERLLLQLLSADEQGYLHSHALGSIPNAAYFAVCLSSCTRNTLAQAVLTCLRVPNLYCCCPTATPLKCK